MDGLGSLRARSTGMRSVPDTSATPLPNQDWVRHRARDTQLTVDTVRATGTAALVRVTGELDMVTAAPLWAVLQSHLGSGRRFLRLDLSGVTFLDATALSAITRVHREALAQRGTLIITGVRTAVARMLTMTGLDEVLFVSGPHPVGLDELPVDVTELRTHERNTAIAGDPSRDGVRAS